MSEYKELVKDLNDLQELPPMECIEEYHNAHDRKLYGRAASELERLAFIREAWVGATEGYVRRAEAAEAEVERLKGVLGKIADGDVPREAVTIWRADGIHSKHDKCGHERVMYDDCDNCTSEFARSALEAKP